MTTDDETKPPNVAAQLAALHNLTQQFDEALRTFGREMVIASRRIREQQEVGALFALYRDGVLYRRGKDAPPRAEVQARLAAVLDGYEPTFLDDLAEFARWLRDQPQVKDRA